MKKLHKDRLLKLALHLEKGKLGHARFDFSIFNGDKGGNQLEENGCGYAGCAIGECPTVFRHAWKFLNGHPVLRGRSRSDVEGVWHSGQSFFCLTQDEFGHLFVPGSQLLYIGDGGTLYMDATRKQVAKGIRTFIAHKESEASL